MNKNRQNYLVWFVQRRHFPSAPLLKENYIFLGYDPELGRVIFFPTHSHVILLHSMHHVSLHCIYTFFHK